MKIDAQLLDQCRTMAFGIAPELRQQPFYVLDAAALDASIIRAAGDVLGFALVNQLSQVGIRDAIADWAGWGPAIVLNGQAIADVALEGQFERCVLNTTLHEAAHIVPVVPPYDATFEPDGIHIDKQRTKLAADLAGPTFEPGSADDKDEHDMKFYRRVAHLLVRANAAGFDPCHDGLLPSCSRTDDYLRILLREALAMQTATFAEINAAAIPPGLAEQFEADRQHYRDFQSIMRRTQC